MTPDQWKDVDQYISQHLVPSDDALEAALQSSAAAGLPAINVTPPQGKFLHLLAKLTGARNILEIGTLGGYSTIWLARALPPGGHLITLELNEKHAEVAKQNLARANVAHLVELCLGQALDLLSQLESEKKGPFDLIFIDADKKSLADYFNWSLKLSRPGTVIIADNIVRKGAILDESSTDPNVQGARRLYDTLAAEPRVITTALQTVGSKGYDGFAIALVTSNGLA